MKNISSQGQRIAVWLALLAMGGYSIWTMLQAIHRSYAMNQKITQLKNKIRELEVANENTSNLLAYYQTLTFQELEARRRLGLKKSGEKIFVIPDHQKNSVSFQITQPAGSPDQSSGQGTPNYQKWFKYVWTGNP